MNATPSSPALAAARSLFGHLPAEIRFQLDLDEAKIAATAAEIDRHFAPPAPAPLDQYENALIQFLKRTASHPTKLRDLQAIWGWRNAIPADHVPLWHLAGCMWDCCERLGLMGCSNTIPMEHGPLGILMDAAPDRAWMFGLETGDVPTRQATDDRAYWVRIIAVLASRLRMSRVSELPGYDHDANAGPFSYTAKGEAVEVLNARIDRAATTAMDAIMEAAR